MLKYNGWPCRVTCPTSSNAVTVNPIDSSQSNYAFVGNGFDHQLSYNFPSNYEIIGRYSTSKVGEDIRLWPKFKQYTVGVTKYIWEHTLNYKVN
jgi:hypothetical protein